GPPAKTVRPRNSPVLAPAAGERLEVRDPDSGEWEAWERFGSFVESRPGDPHYTLDLAQAGVELGPAIRAAEGGWRQYGIVPPKGAMLRFTKYRFGGGRSGNVAAGALSVLKSAMPGVSSVVNPAAAFGGVDAETLESTRRRAAMDFHTRHRAVTVDDFEFLAGEASQRVAR